MLFSNPCLGLVATLSLAGVARSIALPFILDPPTPTVELLPYNAEHPGASPTYIPKPPALILPISDVLQYAGAAEFPKDSRLGKVVAAVGSLGLQPADVAGLDDKALAGLITDRGRRNKRELAHLHHREKRQLCGLFGNCPKPSTATVATPATSTTAPPAQGGCGFLGLQACPPKTTAAPSSAPSSSSSTVKTSTTSSAAPSASSSAPPPVACLSGVNENVINTLFNAGGASTTVYLCPGAVINTGAPIQFTAAKQVLTTSGSPTDSTRATIVVTGAFQTTAIMSTCTACSQIELRCVQVNGNRAGLGYLNQQLGGAGLIEAGGSNQGQIIDSIRAYDPRSWSSLHVLEGTNNLCSGAFITNNVLGPSGQPPQNPSNQFQGEWADGLSLGCQKTTVTGNTLVDATDGAVVIFGAPGSILRSNTILQKTRQVMGGINMLDTGSFAGSYEGVVVEGNTFSAESAFIKIGIAMGPNVWGSNNVSIGLTHGGTIRNNLFTSGTGAFGWSIGIAGHTDATLSGNSFRSANFAGKASAQCTAALPPTPQPLVIDPSTSRNIIIDQLGFNKTSIQLLICEAPSTTMTTAGFTATY